MIREDDVKRRVNIETLEPGPARQSIFAQAAREAAERELAAKKAALERRTSAAEAEAAAHSRRELEKRRPSLGKTVEARTTAPELSPLSKLKRLSSTGPARTAGPARPAAPSPAGKTKRPGPARVYKMIDGKK